MFIVTDIDIFGIIEPGFFGSFPDIIKMKRKYRYVSTFLCIFE